MQERGNIVDHSTLHRWSLKIPLILALIFRRRKCPVGMSWRLDETYIKVAGQWKYLYRAINLLGQPEKITFDKSAANTTAIKSVNVDVCLNIELRQSKYRNNIDEQDHRAVKQVTNPMMGFKSFWSAQKLIAGIETMHMIKLGQLHCPGGQVMSAAKPVLQSGILIFNEQSGFVAQVNAIATQPKHLHTRTAKKIPPKGGTKLASQHPFSASPERLFQTTPTFCANAPNP